MMVAVAWVVSYVIGSVPTAYLLARGLKGVDIRTVGSGNVGGVGPGGCPGRGAFPRR